MSKLKSKRAFSLAETLIALTLASALAMICAFGMITSIRSANASSLKASADALAQTAAQYIKNEIRFSLDPDATIEALSEYKAYLNGLSTENLKFDTAPDGSVIFSFNVAEGKYEYKAFPLNREFITDSDLGTS